MSWKGFFEGIQSLFENVLFIPLDALRNLEPQNWWLASIANWMFLIIGFAAFFYWMKQLRLAHDDGTEDRTSTAHTYLG